MANILQDAAGWLAEQMQVYFSTEVVYRRAGASATFNAALGSQLLRLTDGKGATKVQRTDRDFLFRAADLVLSGSLATPIRGDTVDVTLDDVTKRYEVLALGSGEASWRYSDPHETIIRLHTKYTGTV